MLAPLILSTDIQEVIDNIDQVHKFFIKSVSALGFDLGFSKYNTLALFNMIKNPDMAEAFEATWHHPAVLKLMIHGRNDGVFSDELLNEKAIYYTYKRSLNPQY